MARLEPTRPRGLLARLCMWVLRRMMGRDLRPLRIAAHAPRVVTGVTLMNAAFETGRWSLEPGLRKLVHLRVASLIGCVF
jgi:alkylhydroperoxidase family enzyme